MSLLEYLAMAERFRGTEAYLAFGAVVKTVCIWHDITVDYDETHITVNAIQSVIKAVRI